jgi:hypothetical protein
MEQIHPSIPADKAWRSGRRLYVRSAKGSKLSNDIYALGAHWDRDEYAQWTGSGKLTQVIALILAEDARGADDEQTRTLGLWVKIPYEAHAIRSHVKDTLHAVYGGDARKGQWAMRNEDDLADVQARIAEYEAGVKAARDAAKARKAAEAAITDEDIIARSGRTLVSPERVNLESHQSQWRMKRAEAERHAPDRGEIQRTRDGKYWLTLKASTSFWNEDTCADLAPHLQPGWHYTSTAVQVMATEEETAAELELAGIAEDSQRLAALFKDASDWEKTPVPDGDRVPGSDAAGIISASTGTADKGTLTLTRDSRVHWYHPGYYDMWIVSCWTSTAPDAVQAVSTAIAGGSRTRTAGTVTYTVTVP